MTRSSIYKHLDKGTVRLHIVENLDEITRYAADEIVRQLEKPASYPGSTAIALSGGSTPVELYRRLGSASTAAAKIRWNDLHLFWGDERHVPPDHPQSNYRLVRETLLKRAPVPKQNIHRVLAENPDAAAAADHYEQELLSFYQLREGRLPRFDCALLGIGPDGHTASLFPGTTALRETKRLVVANRVEKLQTYRITMTAPVLCNAALILILVSGREKADVLKEIFEGDYRPDELPVQLIRPVRGKLLWLVDRTAAGRLSDSTRQQYCD
jgi:6-phosphogluconolactonase